MLLDSRKFLIAKANNYIAVLYKKAYIPLDAIKCTVI
jgi:hypothetical protein